MHFMLCAHYTIPAFLPSLYHRRAHRSSSLFLSSVLCTKSLEKNLWVSCAVGHDCSRLLRFFRGLRFVLSKAKILFFPNCNKSCERQRKLLPNWNSIFASRHHEWLKLKGRAGGLLRKCKQTLGRRKARLRRPPALFKSQFKLCWVRKRKWFFHMHNIVGREWAAESKLLPASSQPTAERRTLQSSLHFLSRSSAWKSFPFFPFHWFVYRTRKNHADASELTLAVSVVCEMEMNMFC